MEYYILDIFAKWWLGAHVNQKQLLSVSSAFKECGLVVSWWHCSYTSLYMEEKTKVQICAGVLSSWTHVESGESRSLHDEDLVADGIR